MKHISFHFLSAMSCFAVLSCGPAMEKIDTIKDQAVAPPVDTNERILIEPVKDAKGLLGRQVVKREDGSYEIGERAPGCNVQFRIDDSAWKRTITGTVDKFAGFSASFGAVAQLQAKYKNGIRSVSSIENETTIKADLSGDCGSAVIHSVKVGVGRRDYEYKVKKESSGEAEWKSVGGGGAAGSSESLGYSIEWSEPQAWSFTVGAFNPDEQAELSINMPERLKDGQVFTPELTTGDRQMWLIIAACWAENECAVLRPSSNIPVEIAPVRRTYKLKPMKAKALEGKESRETLIIYGFTEEAEFKKMRPPLGALSPAEAAEYVNGMPALIKKHGIPAKRWANLEFKYVIEGKAPALSTPVAEEATESDSESDAQ